MNVTIEAILVAAVPALLVIGAVIWAHVQQQAAIDRLDDRIAHLMAGVSLLTDTTEGALRDVAVEIGRLAVTVEGARPPAPAVTQRRIASASRRGRTVQDIAANEQVSEGEVRLHLQLDKSRKERTHASLR
jgi:DNA-binding NarL/FixJ family response regulator